MMAMRVRNYSAERIRRNELARERGYTSLDAQHKARTKGVRSPLDFAPLRGRKVEPRPEPPREEAKRIPEWLSGEGDLNAACRAWAREHGRQPGTRNFNTRWPLARRLAFYDAFVNQDGQHRDAIDDYIAQWPNGFRSEIVEQLAHSRQFYANRK